MRKTVDTLTGMRRNWRDRYLVHFNATRAAREAGYAHPNKSGPKMLKDPTMLAAIEAALIEQVMTRDEALARLSSQARAEYSEYYKIHNPKENITEEEENGRLYINSRLYFDLAQFVADGKGHLIKGISETKFGTNIEFQDAQKALVYVGKHHKLFADTIIHGIDPDLAEILDEIGEEAEIEL